MKINLNIGQQNNFLNNNPIKQIFSRKAQNLEDSVKNENRDVVSISPKGKAMSLLENLMKQKMEITDQKNSLIGSTLEKGDSLDSIKSQLELYENQLKSIDEQMANVMKEDVEKQTEKIKEKNDNKEKTEKEVENERLKAVSNLSTDLKKTKTLASIKSKVDGEARVLKSEIELDKNRTSSGAAIASGAISTKKEELLKQLEEKSINLEKYIGEKHFYIMDKVKDSNENKLSISQEDKENNELSKIDNEE